jgi:outer membrane protein OmpA-like peptidoglycan-associated protein
MARRSLLVPLLLTLVAAAATAQDVRLYRAGDAVDPNEVATILAQPEAKTPAVKMRSIRLLDDRAAASAGLPAAAVAVSAAYAATNAAGAAHPVVSALSLPVQFAFDSADILPTARQQLDALAQGIALLPGAKSVVIEGHTDAIGARPYNEDLSKRRAMAVKHYLVASHHIDPARLRTVGMGQDAPLAGHSPRSAENRRVQFRGE